MSGLEGRSDDRRSDIRHHVATNDEPGSVVQLRIETKEVRVVQVCITRVLPGLNCLKGGGRGEGVVI